MYVGLGRFTKSNVAEMFHSDSSPNHFVSLDVNGMSQVTVGVILTMNKRAIMA